MLVTIRFTASMNFAPQAAHRAAGSWVWCRHDSQSRQWSHPTATADDSFHHADVDLLSSERAPLLNMQLKVGKNVAGLAAYAGQATGSPPMNAIPSRSVFPLRVVSFRFSSRNSPEIARLPCKPPSSFWKSRPPGYGAMRRGPRQSLCHLDRTQGTNDAVIVAPCGTESTCDPITSTGNRGSLPPAAPIYCRPRRHSP